VKPNRVGSNPAGRGVVDMVALGSDGLAGSGLVCEVKATRRTAATEATATPAPPS
jgi:hypothetical protein